MITNTNLSVCVCIYNMYIYIYITAALVTIALDIAVHTVIATNTGAHAIATRIIMVRLKLQKHYKRITSVLVFVATSLAFGLRGAPSKVAKDRTLNY